MAEIQNVMIPYLRRKRILDLLCKTEIMSLEALQKELSPASISTIRRDVLHLQSEKQVQMLRGGSVKLYNADEVDLPEAEKARINKESKERIARYAAGLVHKGETIYIDSGTTAALMIRYLREIDIIIVSSSTRVIDEANRFQGTLIVLGGEVNKTLASISGPTTDRQLSEMYFDRAFIGTSGFSIQGGITTYDMREASKKRIAQTNSDITYVLADSSKAGRNALCKAFSLSECILITDEANEITRQVNAEIVP